MSDRIYEILFIADPNLGEPEVDALAAQVQGFVEKDGGRLQKMEKWGKKRLAYDVRRHREGYYVLLVVEGTGAMVKEVERRIKVTDGIIRFLTVRVDEDALYGHATVLGRVFNDRDRDGRMGATEPGVAGEEELVRAYGRDNPEALTAEDIMSEGVPELGADLPLTAAAQIMKDKGIRIAYMMHNSGGIIYPAAYISYRHVLRHMAARNEGELKDLGLA